MGEGGRGVREIDFYRAYAVCENCKFEDFILARLGKPIHSQRCPRCHCEGYMHPGTAPPGPPHHPTINDSVSSEYRISGTRYEH